MKRLKPPKAAPPHVKATSNGNGLSDDLSDYPSAFDLSKFSAIEMRLLNAISAFERKNTFASLFKVIEEIAPATAPSDSRLQNAISAFEQDKSLVSLFKMIEEIAPAAAPYVHKWLRAKLVDGRGDHGLTPYKLPKEENLVAVAAMEADKEIAAYREAGTPLSKKDREKTIQHWSDEYKQEFVAVAQYRDKNLTRRK